MVQPMEETVVGAPTYVPEPFQGLPEVFDVEEPNGRSWRLRHRSTRSARKGEPEADEIAPITAAPPVAQDPPASPATAAVLVAPEQRAAPPEPAPVPPPDLSAPRVVVQPASVIKLPQIPAAPPVVEVAPPPPPPVVEVAPPPPPPVVEVAPPPPPPVVEVATPPLAPSPVPFVEVPPAGPPPIASVRPTPAPSPKPPLVRPAAPTPPVEPAAIRFPRAFERTQPPAAAAQPVLAPIPAPDGLATYEPDPYQPNQAGGAPAPTTVDGVLMLGFGVVLPQQRRSNGRVVLVVLLVALLGAGLFAWRQLRGGDAAGNAAGPVAYRSKLAHFAAQFPNAPAELTVRRRLAGHTMTLRVASDQTAKVAVGAVEISPAIPKPKFPEFARGASQGFANGGSLTLRSQHRLTFRGHVALSAQYWAADGTPVSMLAILYSGQRFFLLIGETGETFDAFEKSFVMLR